VIRWANVAASQAFMVINVINACLIIMGSHIAVAKCAAAIRLVALIRQLTVIQAMENVVVKVTWKDRIVIGEYFLS